MRAIIRCQKVHIGRHFLVVVLLTFNLTRHDLSEAFKGRYAGKVKEHREAINKGIVTEDCFRLLYSQCENKSPSTGALSMDDIWNFLIAFKLASRIEEPRSLYIPALIPDLKEEHLNRKFQDTSRDEASRGFYYSFAKCDKVFGLFSRLLCQLASKTYFYKTEDPGITFSESFSAKIENRKLGIVAAMAGRLQYFDQDQDQTDKIEFIVAEKDCNDVGADRRFGTHKVDNHYILELMIIARLS